VSTPLTHEAFVEQLDSKFRLLGKDAETIELVLVSVSELRTTERQEIFTIQFRGSADFVIPQNMYRLENEGMGQMDLFFTAVGKDRDSVTYESVFNRLLK
jgi:hypothetical protein